ncbi:Retinoic acid induced 16-like protein-domain-containing protein [Amylocarpus encephaloides]|uniref:Retinoic acid induced 16-like protein-domain-containing protein n=1 Tax=Amylocarpus encephaloides TaxID=45428 RepID=A0A9P7YNV9_9HELO|nr:Retinoic acid induced 16-like protein-domain-containing protein [Amylocarpus encephaloides]
MDFWSRLIAGTSLAPGGSRGSSSNPEKRLARFKREYSQLLQTWRGTSNLSRDNEAADEIRGNIQDLMTILSDESRRPLPHPCIVFASSKQIYIPIGKIATTSYNEGIIREGVALFATLIDSEEENFVENDAFSKSLMNLLVRITGANSIRLSSETESEVVELSFNITTKIRLEPEVLPAWFAAQQRDETADGQDAHEKFTGKTQKEDFPLFYLLIDYIHHEGRIGDFARTGLLYIIEAASNSVTLEQWIVESDLATLMATGLGALYSQLSRKLVIDYPPGELPPSLALSDYAHPVETSEIVSSASPDFQSHMETFLSHLVFWQDVLNHCKSVEVKQTLLEHFQVIFLQQLLYPSLLESSDVDGGSSVAVLTYLRRILESLDHPDMIHLILHYLLALPDATPAPSGSRASISAARKRKSMDLATMMAVHIEVESTPALFNLVDLIQASLISESEQTKSVTLQLISVILRRHHKYAVTTLLWTSQLVPDGPQRTIGAYEKEMEFLLELAGSVGGEDNFDEVYENHVQDIMSALESHPCSITLIAPKSAGGTLKFPGSQASIPGAPRDLRPHTLRPEDPMLKKLLEILATFFTNSIETNFALVGVIVDLATCGFMRIEGWLLPEPSKYVYDEEEEDEEDPYLTSLGDAIDIEESAQIRVLRKMQRVPSWKKSKIPTFLTQLNTLIDQIQAYRSTVPRFEELLQQRRDAFSAASSTLATSIPIRHQPALSESSSRSTSPPRKSGFDSLAQRMFPELSTPSRSNSPRGRQSQDQQRSSGSGLSGGYGLATPTNNRQAPTSNTPSRDSSRAFSPSPLRDNEAALRAPGVPASQAAAFAAIDQSILARKVSLPVPNSEMPPIPFPDLRGGSDTVDEAKESKMEEVELEDTVQDADPIEERRMRKEVTISHVLTNVLILQEFVLEIAALVQVRAGLFGEVRFV